MKTISKIIIAIALMASFVPCSYGQDPKVMTIKEKIIEEYNSISHDFSFNKHIIITYDDGIEMEYVVYTNTPKVYILHCNHVSGHITIPKSIESDGIVYSVTGIDDMAFFLCAGLTSITIPNSVTCIKNAAFLGCTGLTSITIPSSVTHIGIDAFSGCTGLTSITIPNSVKYIGRGAFSGCIGLTSITIPNSVTDVEPGFYMSAKKLAVAQGNKKYDNRDNCNAIIETATNTLIAACDNTRIPNSVTRIGDGAFAGCMKFTSIAIPNNVTSIGNRAFADCGNLISINIPNSVTSIGDNAFENCMNLTSIIIPNSVTSIGEGAFYGCENLTSVTIESPNLRSSIDYNDVFLGCDKFLNTMTEKSHGTNKTEKSYDTNKAEKPHNSNQSTVKTITFHYQSDVMSFLRDHRFENSSGRKMTFTNSTISVDNTVINLTNFEVVKWDAETAIVKATTVYGTTLTFFVYGAEGHIVDNESNMYFAK